MSTKGWQQEAALRMLMNNLDPEVAEARTIWWCTAARESGAQLGLLSCHRARARDLENDETLLIQSGKPVGILRTHEPRRAC